MPSSAKVPGSGTLASTGGMGAMSKFPIVPISATDSPVRSGAARKPAKSERARVTSPDQIGVVLDQGGELQEAQPFARCQRETEVDVDVFVIQIAVDEQTIRRPPAEDQCGDRRVVHRPIITAHGVDAARRLDARRGEHLPARTVTRTEPPEATEHVKATVGVPDGDPFLEATGHDLPSVHAVVLEHVLSVRPADAHPVAERAPVGAAVASGSAFRDADPNGVISSSLAPLTAGRLTRHFSVGAPPT